MAGRLSQTLKPDFVIPFKLDKNRAKEELKSYTRKRRFAPKLFNSENKLDEIKGLYVPFWLFDSDASASVNYSATRTTTWSDSNYRYTTTDHFDVFRSGTMSFCTIPVDGSTKMDDTLMQSIEPYDFKDAVDFQTAYLSGYLADKYDVDAEHSVGTANERIKNTTESTFRESVQGYNTVTKESGHIALDNAKAQYALYPVWILNTSWNDQKYTFAMNGQTGKFVGDLPIDKGKAVGLFIGASAIASVCCCLLASFLGYM